MSDHVGNAELSSSSQANHDLITDNLNNNSTTSKSNKNFEVSPRSKSKSTEGFKNGIASGSKFELDFTMCQPSTSTIKCLLCSFANMDARVVEEHINNAHFDIGAFSTETEIQSLTFSCPMCPNEFPDSKTLQSHVNRQHRDILSPIKTRPDCSEPREVEVINFCPVCNTFSSSSPEELTRHVESHFLTQDQPNCAPNTTCDSLIAAQHSKRKDDSNLEEQREFKTLKVQYGMDDESNFKEQSIVNMQRAVRSGRLSLSGYYEKQVEMKMAECRGTDDGSSCVKNIIPGIREKSRISTNVVQTYVCYNTDFYSSSYGDKGWGCGYRNTQMLLSALSRNKIYAELLSKHFPSNFNVNQSSTNFMPSISKIQEMIEWAWQQGFDVQGCEQLGGKVCNTRKWIGATEVTALFSSMKIKCELIDTLRPSVAKLHYRMFDWIVSYFKKNDSFKPPLYLQHDGHSRTIIGVEILKDGDVILLILDPSIESYKIENMVTSSNPFSTLKLLRKTLSNMTSKQYQIVSVCGVIDSEEEYQARKILHSTKIQ